MNTTAHETDDDHLAAVRHAEIGQQAWRDAVLAQQTARPNHTDFYNTAAALSPTLAALTELGRLLHRQVRDYDHGRRVYDDTHTVDPHVRLARAAEQLLDMQDALTEAGQCLERFWSDIGHIGVEAVD